MPSVLFHRSTFLWIRSSYSNKYGLAIIEARLEISQLFRGLMSRNQSKNLQNCPLKSETQKPVVIPVNGTKVYN